MLSLGKQLLNTEESGLRYCMKAAPFLEALELFWAGPVWFHCQTPSSGCASSPAAAGSLREKSRIYGFRSLLCRVLPSYGYCAPLEEQNEHSRRKKVILRVLLPFNNILLCDFYRNLWRESHLCKTLYSLKLEF